MPWLSFYTSRCGTDVLRDGDAPAEFMMLAATGMSETKLGRCAASSNSYRRGQKPHVLFFRSLGRTKVPLIPALKEGGDVRFGNIDLKASWLNWKSDSGSSRLTKKQWAPQSKHFTLAGISDHRKESVQAMSAFYGFTHRHPRVVCGDEGVVTSKLLLVELVTSTTIQYS